MPAVKPYKGKAIADERQQQETAEMEAFMTSPLTKALSSGLICANGNCETPVAQEWSHCPMCGGVNTKNDWQREHPYNFDGVRKKFGKDRKVIVIKPKLEPEAKPDVVTDGKQA